MRMQMQGERRESSDNFIDKAFTVMADIVVNSMPLSQQEKDAYQFYRDGMAAQTAGDYSTALRAYAESLRLEEDPIDRSFIFYNLGIIFASNGEYVKAVKYYHLALDQNKELCQAYNNVAVIYHNQGTKAERQGNQDKAMALYDKAAQYWNQAVRIAPTNYLEAQGWLKEPYDLVVRCGTTPLLCLSVHLCVVVNLIAAVRFAVLIGIRLKWAGFLKSTKVSKPRSATPCCRLATVRPRPTRLRSFSGRIGISTWTLWRRGGLPPSSTRSFWAFGERAAVGRHGSRHRSCLLPPVPLP